MSNEILWFLFLVFDLSTVLLAYRFWGRSGLYVMIAVSAIICNIQVIIIVRLFGLVATLGNIIYASIFLSTDILSECYGKKEAQRGVWIGFFFLFWAIIAMQFAIHYIPDASDSMMPHVKTIFLLMPRVALASLAAYLISQHHDVWMFHFWMRKTGGKHLWIRNNVSTMVSQLIDTVVFCLGAFWGVFSNHELLQIIITTYLLKFIVAVLDTPFIYLARVVKNVRDKK